MRNCRTIGHRTTQNRRCMRLEPLEPRMMLSHPSVTAVNVAGTGWSSSFISFLESSGLGAGGYAIPAGANQLKTLPWTNVNQIRITFSEDVNVDAADLSVSGANTTAYTFSGFSYDSTAHTATWTLSASLTKDKVLLDLDADGMDPVVSISTGDALSGGWTNGSSTFPSGDGTTVADFEFRMNILPGDANQNNAVNVTDAAYVNQKIGTSAGQAGYNIYYDMDGSGAISSCDYSAVTSRLASLLPTGSPAGTSNDAPTTAGIADVYFDSDDEDDYSLGLSSLFEDAETLSTDLVYSIVGNTNTSLFDSLSIDSTGQLAIDFVADAIGESSLAVRAVDAGGLIVETTFTVHASNAPKITDFGLVLEEGGAWTISGSVTDPDESVVGMVVRFGGVLADYHLTTTITRADGVFSLTVELPGLQVGIATATTKDSHGVASEEADFWVVTI